MQIIVLLLLVFSDVIVLVGFLTASKLVLSEVIVSLSPYNQVINSLPGQVATSPWSSGISSCHCG